ncbi:DUF1499 domain-containing protein [Rhodobacteraceae bacterium D3-12]|nr:DUF1499 domain-containing protein [Rhodobacteraceae bacterium D3-12]
MIFTWIFIAALVALVAYIRFAPSDPGYWHVMPEEVVHKAFDAGVIRVVETGSDGLARLDPVARGWPRTRVLAGSVEEGMITYVTRTALWGFPDYTTVRQAGGQMQIYARLRFGRKDFGVNRARVEAWLEAL